jgi:hypothetical protein
MLDISALLEEIKASPYEEIVVVAPHTGVVTFPDAIQEGVRVLGPTGTWKEKEGTVLAVLERECNPRSLFCPEKGEISQVRRELQGTFVEAGTELVRFRHFLSREEVQQIILRRALSLFCAPERAKYYFVPAVDIKIKVSGPKAVSVRDGEEIFIMSRMKREAPLRYTGPEGVMYAIYFAHHQNIDAGQPLIGVCPPDMVEQVEEVVMRVQTEWKERG